MSEKFTRVRLGDMYLKDFKIACVKGEDNYWRVKKEITFINDKNVGIPIVEEEAKGLADLIDKHIILENFEGSE